MYMYINLNAGTGVVQAWSRNAVTPWSSRPSTFSAWEPPPWVTKYTVTISGLGNDAPRCTDFTASLAAVNTQCPTSSGPNIVPTSCDDVSCAEAFITWYNRCFNHPAVQRMLNSVTNTDMPTQLTTFYQQCASGAPGIVSALRGEFRRVSGSTCSGKAMYERNLPSVSKCLFPSK